MNWFPEKLHHLEENYKKPRNFARENHRENVPAQSANEYY
jgi:hypothetical protein